jgi:hypothetical protein
LMDYGCLREMSGRRRADCEDDDGLVIIGIRFGPGRLVLGGHGRGVDMSVESQQLANYYTNAAIGGKLKKGGGIGSSGANGLVEGALKIWHAHQAVPERARLVKKQ